ncbi:uncharacterized protein BDR25DRAFT_354156 [Lindgomyces ingoldianus]|uniref:Uncharacterized protein n=1 Tax=Lindgomyces ingoldianus TaxID=673940 RepID=A0ACB6QYK9_9PLEO|nr:uncharacterized protein BDR25DRAFT_354156 [Lindgomyces ingoldianus]KAF2471653.1 hypothetical protein BDR25DRAFT_354156 [Lindgomyces ingoldianus]
MTGIMRCSGTEIRLDSDHSYHNSTSSKNLYRLKWVLSTILQHFSLNSLSPLLSIPQYGLYKRENFWKSNETLTPPFSIGTPSQAFSYSVLPHFTDYSQTQANSKSPPKQGSPNGWLYTSSSMRQSYTHIVNLQSFYRHRIIPRMLVDTNTRDISTTIFGHNLPVAKVSGELMLPYWHSAASLQSIEDVAKANDELGKARSFFIHTYKFGLKAGILTFNAYQAAWRRGDLREMESIQRNNLVMPGLRVLITCGMGGAIASLDVNG